MSGLLRFVPRCKSHILGSYRLRRSNAASLNILNRACDALVTPNSQGCPFRGPSLRTQQMTSGPRIYVQTFPKKRKRKTKKKLQDAHAELLQVLDLRKTHLKHEGIISSGHAGHNPKEAPLPLQYGPDTKRSLQHGCDAKGPLQHSPGMKLSPPPDKCGSSQSNCVNDNFLKSLSHENNPNASSQYSSSHSRKPVKTRKVNVLGTKIKTKVLPHATTLTNSDIQMMDAAGTGHTGVSAEDVFYLDSSIPQQEVKLMDEIEGVMQTGLTEPLKEQLQALVDSIKNKDDSTVTEKNQIVALEKMVKGLSRKSNIVPFWNPEELKSMKEITVASQLVRFLNSELGKERALQQHMQNEKLRKEHLHNLEVKTFIDACIQADMVKAAHTYLVTLHLRNQQRAARQSGGDNTQGALSWEKKVTDSETYNLLIRAWAKQGNLESVRQLFQLMQQEQIRPTLCSYVHCLQCLGRMKSPHREIIARVLWDLERAGHDVKSAMHQCPLQQGEWHYALKAIKVIYPDFKPYDAPPPAQYTCQLLAPLNELSPTGSPVENPHRGIVDTDTLYERAQLQLKLEENGFVSVPSIATVKKANKLTHLAQEKLKGLESKWRIIIRNSIERALEEQLAAQKHRKNINIYPYMKLLPPEKLTDYVMQEIAELAMEMQLYSPSVALLQRILGYKIYRQCLVLQRRKTGFVDKMLKVYQEYLEVYNCVDLQQRNHRQAWQDILDSHQDGTTLDGKAMGWPGNIASEIGKLLYTIILMDIKIPAGVLKAQPAKEELPAFYTMNQQSEALVDQQQRSELVIRPHPEMSRLYEEAQVTEMKFSSSDMPSLVPPPPWCSMHKGGTFLSTVNLVKNKPQYQKQLEQLSECQLYPVLDALNTVSSVPWIINKPMLDVVIDVFNGGGDPKLDIPSPTSSFPEPPKITKDMDAKQRAQVFQQRRALSKEIKEMHSLWMTELYRLSIANKYRNDVFWFPHNLDFRGRCYAIPPHFNHLGADLARSILVFAKAKPLGVHGLDWLKIHIVNLTGLKKRSSNAERLQYATEILPEIMDSADNPFTGNKWWQSSDEPWQTLACCMEITKAIRSGDPAAYMSHFPVHQDGSCNGLQHYAALGRDQAGAESVNLHPFHVPKDVYSDVVELVEQERIKDAANGVEIAQVLDGFIRRKVIKQTIMTTVYGVTNYGARLQIRGQLKDIEDFPDKHVPAASSYLTEKTFLCLEQMFTRTKEIQDWLTVSAELISTISNQPVSWETPIGFPVMQPYFQQMRDHAGKWKSGKRKSVTYERPNMRRQRNGFPPNFIHSLDATHMMLTAVYCLRAGVTFVSVHDCFWTHAADVEMMNKITREQFVALHSEPILESLALGMLDQFGFTKNEDHDGSHDDVSVDPITQEFVNSILSRVPERGNFELKKVLESTYFFS